MPEEARWDKIASCAHTPEIETVIDKAMRVIERENTSLKNVSMEKRILQTTIKEVEG